jgi:integral membrane protein (TIGR00529 family)
MDTITNTPYVFRVLISLLIILVVNKYTRQLSFSVIAGTLTLALWTGQSFQDIVFISWTKLSGANMLFLLLIIFQVIWLSNQMSMTGVMKDLVEQVQSRTSQRFSIALLPAIIGLLPMPGGALFSAPLVENCDRERALNPILKTKINYWFRHIWEYWWPLYPGVLLAMEITGLTILQFILLQIWWTFISVYTGYLFLLRKIRPRVEERQGTAPGQIKSFSRLVLPIIIIIGVVTLVNITLPQITHINKYLPMITGILCAQIVLQWQRPLDPASWIKIIFSKSALLMVLIVALVLIYGAFVDARLPDGTLLISHMRSELSSWGIPLFFIFILIPFISGLTTGLAIGFVGASFPIVISLLGQDPDFKDLLSTVILAFGSGYAGMLLSPVHVCLIVSNKHFKTSLTDSLLQLLAPVSIIQGAAIVLYFLI